MTNIAKWKIPTMNGGANSWENHLFRLGPSIPVRYVSHNQRVPTQTSEENHGSPQCLAATRHKKDRTTTCGDGEEEPLRAVDLKNVEISKDPCGDPLWRVIFSHENGDF